MRRNVFAVGFLVLGSLMYVQAAKKYTTKYDNIDIDNILASDRLTLNYVNCLLDKGRCTPDAAEMKSLISDALETDCEKCSPKQKELGKKVIRNFLKHRRPLWEQLQAKYDPKKKYVERYRDQLKKEGIEV